MTARPVLRRATITLLTLVLALAPVGAAQAAGPRTNTEQLPGETAVAAAIAWSERTFAGGSASDVLLGRDDRFPDNLASGAPQGILDAPLLLNPSTRLHDDVSAELARLGADTVHILGGGGAIADSVEQALRAEGYATHRHSGATRIETAIEVAREHAASAETAIVSRAFGTAAGDESAAWADALGAGAWAAAEGWPVLLTETERLTPSLATYLRDSDVEKVFVIGGTSAVSSQAVNEINALGIAVERVSGPNRFDTARRIAVRRGFTDASAAQRVILAEGEETIAWAGGFTAAAHANRHATPVVLANGNGLPPETEGFLEPGGNATALWCGPFTSVEACDAAGAQLNQAVTGHVTLTSTTIPRDGAITGTVAPMTDVTGASVRGDCVAPGGVTLDDDGGFAVPLRAEGSATTCDVTFAVAHDDGRTVEQPFTLTLTDVPTVTGAPDLVRVDTVSTGANTATLRFVFDEDVREIATGSGQTPFREKFRLVTPDTALSFPADSATVVNGVSPTVDAVFTWSSQTMNRYALATLATVNGAAVQDRDTRPNPAAGRPLKALAVGAGQTLGPDLTALTGNGVSYTFRFDQPLSAEPAGTGFMLVLANGNTITSAAASRASGNSDVVVTFGTPVDAGTVRRAVVLPSADVCAAVEGATRCSELQALDVSGGGVTALPDLASVSLDTANDRVAYTFDEGASSPVANRFVVVSFSGGQTAGSSVVGTSGDGRTVTVQFPAGIVDESLTLAGTLAGAVQAFGTDAAPDTVGFARTFAAGATFGPQLVMATDDVRELLSGDTRHTVTFRFDMPVELAQGDVTFDGFFLHSARGDRVAPSGCVGLSEEVRCDFTFTDEQGEAVLASVERASVVNDGGAAGGLVFPNPADDQRLTVVPGA